MRNPYAITGFTSQEDYGESQPLELCSLPKGRKNEVPFSVTNKIRTLSPSIIPHHNLLVLGTGSKDY